MGHHPLVLYRKVAIIIQAAVFSFLFVMSLLGFIAALNQARGAVYIYSKFVFTHAALLLLSLGLTLYTTLRPDNSDPNAVAKCLNGSTSPIISQFCNQNLSLVRILSIALLGAAILVQFYAWVVSISYGEELDIEAVAKEFSNARYYASDSDLESQPLSAYPEPPFARRR